VAILEDNVVADTIRLLERWQLNGLIRQRLVGDLFQQVQDAVQSCFLFVV